MGEEVEAHEEEEDGHGEADEDFGAFEPGGWGCVSLGLLAKEKENWGGAWFVKREMAWTYPKGWRIVLRFQTSKFPRTSTPAQRKAPMAS